MVHETRFEKELIFDIFERRIAFLEFARDITFEFSKICLHLIYNDRLSIEDCFRDITKFIGEKNNFIYVGILIFDEVSRELVPYHYYCKKDAEEVIGLVKSRRVKLGEGIIGKAAEKMVTIVVNDCASSPDFIRGPFKETASQTVIPIKIGHSLAGVLDIHDASKDRFKRDLIGVLENFAVHIAYLIKYKKLQQEVDLLNTRLQEEVSKKAAAVKESEQVAMTMLENASDSIVVIDHNFNIMWANKAARTILRKEHLSGVNITKFIKRGKVYEFYKNIKGLIDGEPFKPLEITIETVDANGDTHQVAVEVTASIIYSKGEEQKIELILRDITERSILEKYREKYMEELEKIVIARTREMKDIQRMAILTISNLAESIDVQTSNHLQRIRYYSRILAEELRKNPKYAEEIDDTYVDLIYDLSPLHDVGKVGIKDAILSKEERLSEEEYEQMKKHTEIGAEALKKASEMTNRPALFAMAEWISRHHHQRWDGTGYPAVWINNEFRPLKGTEIPLCARIVALADVYDALTSKRAYKEPQSHEGAKKEILEDSGKAFDPDIVQAFLAREEDFKKVYQTYPD